MSFTVYTIGFTKKSAREFFERLCRAGVRKLVDVRLNNTSQLAGFSKKEDLEYFAQVICGAAYHHMPTLAPTPALLNALKKGGGTWGDYEREFAVLMKERRAIEVLDRGFFEEPACLLCSEDKPTHCHRRLVAEAMQNRWPDLRIVHL